MTAFDGRHKWGPPVRNGVLLSRTCSVCGLTNTVETLIPDSVIDALVHNFTRPNPYRTLFSPAEL